MNQFWIFLKGTPYLSHMHASHLGKAHFFLVVGVGVVDVVEEPLFEDVDGALLELVLVGVLVELHNGLGELVIVVFFR